MGTFSAAVREGLAEEVMLEQGPGEGEERGPGGGGPRLREQPARRSGGQRAEWRPSGRGGRGRGRGVREEGHGEDSALT